MFDVLTASKQSELDMDVETLIPKMTRLSVDYWHNQYNQEQLPLLTNKKVQDWKVEYQRVVGVLYLTDEVFDHLDDKKKGDKKVVQFLIDSSLDDLPDSIKKAIGMFSNPFHDAHTILIYEWQMNQYVLSVVNGHNHELFHTIQNENDMVDIVAALIYRLSYHLYD